MSENFVQNADMLLSPGFQQSSATTASGTTVATRKAEPPHTPLSILIAEDEAISRLFLSRVLTKLGHKVRSARNGQEVLDILGEHEIFDLLLTDIQMPEIDGVELTRILRSSLRFSHRLELPIIAMSAYAMPGDRETFLQAGMDEYLPKPLDSKLLEIMLEQFSGKYQ